MYERTIFYGVLTALAVVFAWHAPKEQRQELGYFALLFAAGWVSYVMSWSDYGVAAVLSRHGVPDARSEDIWALTDALLGMAVFAAGWRYWWGYALWATFAGHVTVHMLYVPLSLIDYPEYPRALDWIFRAQLALFFLIGGRGVRDRITDCIGAVRLRVGQAASQALGRDRA